ncbi:MAG: PA14 domain-containing protein, partial [Dehalococcoidia bacterium]|nr:PA14 domain-containing protein [Dehalococcoidia bacterium]
MWDSGQLWISVNGGDYADVGKDAFTANGYTDVAIIGNGIAKGQNGFGNTSAGHADGSYITTTASLGSLAAGDAVSVRLVALYDDCATGAKPNWEIAGVSSDQMEMSSEGGPVGGTANLEVILHKRADALADEQLSVNGQDVATSVSTDGSTITITGTATDLTPGTAVATVSYNGQSSTWTFTVPEPPAAPIAHDDGTITYETHVAWEWWDGIGGAHPMEALTDNARYPDSPDGATFAPSWNTRTALTGGFEGNGRDNYGGRMSGVLTAPETGTYRFFIASDDHGLLRISTDADPANAVRVAEETGCCKNFTLDDGGLSGTVDLVEGQQYYMEALLKEGGGGDWMTVGWRKPSEDIDSVPGGNQEGIPGEYFTGTVRVPALP